MIHLAEFKRKGSYELPDKVLNYISEYKENSNSDFVIIHVYRDCYGKDKIFILNFGKTIIIMSNSGEKISEFLIQEFNYYLREKKEPILNAVYSNSYFIAKIHFNNDRHQGGKFYEEKIV